MTEHDRLSNLLKIKKLETPCQPYFDAFLDEFHRYQRADLLNQEAPRWKCWLTGVQEAVTATPRPVYALSASFCLCALLVGLALFNQPAMSPSGSPFASQATESRPTTDSVYANPALQQPELLQAASHLEEDFGTPRYVTGNALVAYDTTLAF